MNHTDVRVLTLRQPWASCIAYGTKRIDNRPQPTDYRGVVLVHAGPNTDHTAWNLPLTRPFLRRPLPSIAILAVALLEGCHPDDGYCTLWSAHERWHWRLTAVVRLARLVPCPGGTDRLWTPPAPLLANPRICEALEAARA